MVNGGSTYLCRYFGSFTPSVAVSTDSLMISRALSARRQALASPRPQTWTSPLNSGSRRRCYSSESLRRRIIPVQSFTQGAHSAVSETDALPPTDSRDFRIDLSTPWSDSSPWLDLSRFPFRLLRQRERSTSHPPSDTQSGDPLQKKEIFPDDYVLYPKFLSAEEQAVLLEASLKKLDTAESMEARSHRRNWRRSQSKEFTKGYGAGFLPEEAYLFEQGHFDQVIQGYRECTVSSWLNLNPVSSPTTLPPKPTLESIIYRLYSLLIPSPDVSPQPPVESIRSSLLPPHLLHLSGPGLILPHVDNLMASGTTILGVSLGGERVMRMKWREYDPSNVEEEGGELGGRHKVKDVKEDGEQDKDWGFDVRLESGSVYIQR